MSDNRHSNIAHKALYVFLTEIKQQVKSTRFSEAPKQGKINLDLLSSQELRDFVQMSQGDPQAAFDQIFATPKFKEKVIRILAEYAQKRLLSFHYVESSQERISLQDDCDVLYGSMPNFVKWRRED